MTGLTILGATGSIGENTLALVRQHPGRFRISGLTAHRDVETLARLCTEFDAAVAVIADPALERQAAAALKHAGASQTRLLAGPEALVELAADAHSEIVVAAIVGAAGLPSALAAAESGKRILLANKEALVVSGALFMETARAGGATVIPADSEHNALFQCLPVGCASLEDAGVTRLYLTASGGPFRTWNAERMRTATPDQACAHPNWRMGRKISVDSATLMNKGLELIEACHLFAADPGQIGVLVHPQSIVHGLVYYRDGSVLAQLGSPDMKTPLAQGLFYPERQDAGVTPLDLAAAGRLDFEPPDLDRFPCLGLAFDALERGGAAAIWLNAANEIAVEAFLDGQIPFTRIAAINRHTLDQAPAATPANLEQVLEADRMARDLAESLLTTEH